MDNRIPTESISLGQNDVRELACIDSGKIELEDLYGKEYFPNPKDCDYYFETREDFDNRIGKIIEENYNYDLINKTFGFGDSVTDLSYAFLGTIIRSTPKMIVSKNTTSFEGCFYMCGSLATISKDLFKYNTEVTDFNACFYYCTLLTSIPRNLFKYNTEVTDFDSCFYDCTFLTTVPFDLFDNCKKIEFVTNCFINCKNITSALPDVWNKEKFPNVVNGTYYALACTKASNYNEIPDYFKY